MLFLCYPKCTTCQRAQKWLDSHGVVYTFRNIKSDNPIAAELQRWYKKSGLPLKRFWNTSGLPYRDLGIKSRLPQMTEQEQMDLLSTNGMLVKRPLLIGEDFVLVGFREAEWEKALIKGTD